MFLSEIRSHEKKSARVPTPGVSLTEKSEMDGMKIDPLESESLFCIRCDLKFD